MASIETDVVCEVCGRTDHFSASSPTDLVAAVAAAGWQVDLEHRYCPDHIPTVEVEAVDSEPGDELHPPVEGPAPDATA